MSLRRGSLNTPLLAGLVFCIGLGIGAAWKLGWIPVEYQGAPAGRIDDVDASLAEDDDDDVVAPPPIEAAEFATPLWTVEQSEPPVQIGENAREKLAAESPAKLRRRREEIRAARFEPEAEAEPAGEETSFADDPIESPSDESVAGDRFAEIDAKLAAGEVLAAHKALSKMYWNSDGRDADLQERLEANSKKIFFSPQPHFIEPYAIQPGDQLRKVAAKYNLSWEYLASLNRTDPKRIRAGQKLKVLRGPFAAIVTLHDFSLTVHLQGYYVKRYPVGIGKEGSSPLGKFPVLDKLENPQYTDPDGKVIDGDDPSNPLGERWIDLGDSYGIHGTIDPDSIGRAESRGCIRLRDADIIEVYNFLVRGSIVDIRE